MEFLFSLSINKYKVLAIFWNIFLAVIPVITVYYLALATKRKQWKQLKALDRSIFVFAFLFWLFMFPNTAYLFTIVRHLVNYCFDFDKYRVCAEGTMWMSMFFFTYALIGLPTFYYALKKMSQVCENVFSALFGTLLPVIVIPLTSIGVLFGLFERFNTWDLLTRPWSVVQTGFSYFTDLNLFFNFLVFTISFYLIYYGMDLFIWKVKK